MPTSPAADPPMYLIMGHGQDQMVDFNDRSQQIPPGCKLITFSDAGEAILTSDVCRIVRHFKDPEASQMLQHPEDHKKELSHADKIDYTIHIYNPGDYIPTLSITPMSYWSRTLNGTKYYTFLRSGVYQYPVKDNDVFKTTFKPGTSEEDKKLFQQMSPTIKDCPGEALVIPATKTDANTMKKLYYKSLYPLQSDLSKLEAATLTDPHALGGHYDISVVELMNKLGPGTYYYPICRSDKVKGDYLQIIDAFFISIHKAKDDFMDTKAGRLLTSEERTAIDAFGMTMRGAYDDVKKYFNLNEQLRRFIRVLQSYKGTKRYKGLPAVYREYLEKHTKKPDLNEIEKYLGKVGTIRRLSLVQRTRRRSKTKSKSMSKSKTKSKKSKSKSKSKTLSKALSKTK